MSSYLAPVEKPKGIFIRLGYWYSRKEFGMVFSPLSVFCARMPTAFTRFYTTIGKLDKKVAIAPELTTLIRERVAMINSCAYCMDANRFAAIKASAGSEARFDALDEYESSDLFSAAERAALDYVGELTRDHAVSPETFTALARHYSDREICGIVYVVASEHVYNLTNIGLNIGSDGLLRQLRQVLATTDEKGNEMLGRKDYTQEELDINNLVLGLDRLCVHRPRWNWRLTRPSVERARMASRIVVRETENAAASGISRRCSPWGRRPSAIIVRSWATT